MNSSGRPVGIFLVITWSYCGSNVVYPHIQVFCSEFMVKNTAFSFCESWVMPDYFGTRMLNVGLFLKDFEILMRNCGVL